MLLDELKSITGPQGWSDDPEELLPHLTEWRDIWRGKTSLMVMPDSVEQVSAVVTACATAGTSIVPQGGNTSLCGGAIPDDSGDQILLSLSRMNRIRSLAAQDFSMVAEAGCVLADIQSAAAEADRFFPLSLAAEGSCQIGGNLSTNAGGINVLRYGTARDQVLGLEVVLANGNIWHGLRALRKDTAGYDLKHLFIGSEGTLGIITAAALRLYPAPGNLHTAMVALDTAGAAVELLSLLRAGLSDQIQAFELMPDRAIEFVQTHIPATRRPFETRYPWYVLIESSLATAADSIESILMGAIEAGIGQDAIIAKNRAEAADLWRIRHSISEAQKHEGGSLKHDVSVPVGDVAAFISAAETAVMDRYPDVRIVPFGHVGDGNIHFNVSQGPGSSAQAFLDTRDDLAKIVYDVVNSFDGSISAEHGVGQMKVQHLAAYRGETELALMKSLKKTLDSSNILNPGKVLNLAD